MYPERVAKALQRAQANLNAGDAHAALVDLEKAVQKFPKGFQCWLLYGQAKGRLGDHVGAEQCFRKAVSILPRDINGWNCLGLSYSARGMFQPAADAFSKAVMCAPLAHPDIYHNLGSALLELGRYQEAATVYEETIPRKDTGDLWALLAMCYKGMERYQDALQANLKALERGITGYTIHLNLSSCYSILKDFDSAEKHARAALDAKPGDDAALLNLGLAQMEAGLIQEGLHSLSQSARPDACAARLLALQYIDPVIPQALREAHEAATEALTAGIEARHIVRELKPGERLRVGFVSGDLRLHPVAFFLEGLMSRLDRSQLEVFVYSEVRKPDAVTERFRAMGDHWRETAGIGDDAFVERVDLDALHVLVDLVGHTNGSRMTAYARRLAPVQATYLGYSGTTGLRQMDYVLSDTVLVPGSDAESHYTEQVVRLGPVLATYTPPANAAPGSPLPMDANGYPTFGSFAQRKKISPATIDMWISALKAVPDAKLMVMSSGLSTAAARESFAALFTGVGIDAQRLVLRGPGTMEEYLDAHSQVDVIFDTMPWNGHTTTMHALWMGVPTLTVEGVHHASRLGASVARAAGLERYVVAQPADFAARAAQIVREPARLREERATMRNRLSTSPLFDHDAIARSFGAACAAMWKARASADAAAGSAPM